MISHILHLLKAVTNLGLSGDPLHHASVSRYESIGLWEMERSIQDNLKETGAGLPG